MKREEIIEKLSGINCLDSVALIRFIIGILFIIYAIIVYGFSHISDPWVRISIIIALSGLGVTFILDGQNILREYVRQRNGR